VCQEAGCPNIYECWEDREATFLIGGSQCTRRCDFCQIDTGKPADYDTDEPRRVADSVAHAAALRDGHLRRPRRPPDGGAWLNAETIRQIHAVNPGTGVELLATDFNGERASRTRCSTRAPRSSRTTSRRSAHLQAHPPAFRYERSLDVLTQARAAGLITKSNLILGMGEEPEEVVQALQDLHDAGTDIITITQYLRPAAAPAGRPLGEAARVRRVQGGGRAHRLPRRARRSARALVVPGRTPLGAVDGLEGA
jgi:lipoic acid synthetase